MKSFLPSYGQTFLKIPSETLKKKNADSTREAKYTELEIWRKVPLKSTFRFYGHF